MQLFQSSTAYRQAEAEKGEDVFVSAVRPDLTLMHLPVTEGRWLLPADGHAVVLNRDRADQLGVTIGNKVRLGLEGNDHKSE